MAETLKLKIISPSGLIYEGDVEHVRAPGKGGSFGVLPNHTPMIAAMDVGWIEADTSGGKKDLLATSGGVAEVHSDRVVILAETAELKGDIDVDRAEAAVKRAQGYLQSADEKIDIERAQQSMHRATNRLDLVRS